jgi:WD40 repeat protein
VAFSRDGDRLVAGGWYQVPLRWWSVETGKELGRSETKTGSHGLALSPDGRTLVSAESSGERALRWWETMSGKERRRIMIKDKGFHTAAFSPDGKILAASARTIQGGIPSVIVWDALTGKELPHFKEVRGATALAFVPDSKTLALQIDEETTLWAVGTGQKLRAFPGESRSLAFTPDGKLLAAVQGHKVYFREAATGKEVHPFTGHSSEVASLTFAPDGRSLISSGGGYRDRERYLWQPTTSQAIRPLPGAPAQAFSWAFSADGQIFAWNALPNGDGLIHLCEGAMGRDVRQIRVASPLPVQLISISPDARLLAWWSLGDLALHLTALDTGKEIRTLANPGIWIGFSPDSQTVLTSNTKRQLCLWDVATGRTRLLGSHTSWKAAFSPDGQRLAAQDTEGNLCLWDLATGKARQLGPHPGGVTVLGFSADGRTLVSGGENGTLIVWEVTSGKVLREFSGQQGRVTAVAIAPDGRTLASGSADTTVLIWDLLRDPLPASP